MRAATAAGMHTSMPAASEKLAISGSAVATSGVAPETTTGGFGVARVTTDADIWVASGAVPNPSSAPRRVLLAGCSIDLLVPGRKRI